MLDTKYLVELGFQEIKNTSRHRCTKCCLFTMPELSSKLNNKRVTKNELDFCIVSCSGHRFIDMDGKATEALKMAIKIEDAHL